MGHNICALVIADPYDLAVAKSYGLHERLAHRHIVMFPIDHYWSAYWQAKRGNIDGALGTMLGFGNVPGIFPTEGVVRSVAQELTGRMSPKFAVIMSEYFGGHGEQWGVAFEGMKPLITSTDSVNAALRALGVERADGVDEWDTVGLGDYRSNPDHLERFRDLCDELGV